MIDIKCFRTTNVIRLQVSGCVVVVFNSDFSVMIIVSLFFSFQLYLYSHWEGNEKKYASSVGRNVLNFTGISRSRKSITMYKYFSLLFMSCLNGSTSVYSSPLKYVRAICFSALRFLLSGKSTRYDKLRIMLFIIWRCAEVSACKF